MLPSIAPFVRSAMPETPLPTGDSRGSVSTMGRCSAQDVLRWTGLEAWVPGGAMAGQTLSTRRVRCDKPLVHQQQDLDQLYVVGAGSFKLVRIDSEGFEQVMGFALRGDIIGLDGLNEGLHACTAIALEDSTVALIDTVDVLRPDGRFHALDHLLYRAAATELQRRSQTQYLMAPASAEVRVARFLLTFGLRQQQLGCSGERFRLRMSRRDIASYLGVAHETVSRAFTLLGQAGLIQVDHREVVFTDSTGLQQMATSTRGVSPCARLKRRGRAAPSARAVVPAGTQPLAA